MFDTNNIPVIIFFVLSFLAFIMCTFELYKWYKRKNNYNIIL